MALLNHKFERVPEWYGSFASVGKIAAPRLHFTVVKRIGLWAYLKEYGVDTCKMQAVELLLEYAFVCFCTAALILCLPNSMKPRTAKFSQGICLCVDTRQRRRQQQRGKDSSYFHRVRFNPKAKLLKTDEMTKPPGLYSQVGGLRYVVNGIILQEFLLLRQRHRMRC